MSTLLAASVALASQFLLGGLIFTAFAAGFTWRRAGGGGNRRRFVAWVRSARALGRAAPWATGLLASAFVAQWALFGSLAEMVLWADPIWFVVVGAVPTAGCWLMLYAGHLEGRGRLRRARRQMRLAGQLVFVGVVAQNVLVWGDLLFRVPFRRGVVESPAGVVLLLALVGLGCGSFASVVAALAGKPRPSAYFASLLYVSGVCGLVAAAGIAAGRAPGF